MNCIEAQDLLQRRLDGGAGLDSAALAQHLAGCADCRTLHAAAGRLEQGLPLMRPPVAPASLRTKLAAGVLADRRRRQTRRRMFLGMALAASVMFFMSALTFFSPPAGENWAASKVRQIHDYLWPTPSPQTATWTLTVPKTTPLRPADPPSLRDSVAEAGSAVAALTRRTTSETVEQTRFLTEVLPAPTNVLEAVPPMPEQPIVAVWQETSQRVATGFEPVTASARRALSMLLRETPRPVNQ